MLPGFLDNCFFPRAIHMSHYRRTDWTGVSSSDFPRINSHYYDY